MAGNETGAAADTSRMAPGLHHSIQLSELIEQEEDVTANSVEPNEQLHHGQTKVLGQQLPLHGQTPALGQQPPQHYGQTTALGQQPPQYGRTPELGQQPPQHGQTPELGQQPPQCGQTSALGQQPPQHGQADLVRQQTPFDQDSAPVKQQASHGSSTHHDSGQTPHHEIKPAGKLDPNCSGLRFRTNFGNYDRHSHLLRLECITQTQTRRILGFLQISMWTTLLTGILLFVFMLSPTPELHIDRRPAVHIINLSVGSVLLLASTSQTMVYVIRVTAAWRDRSRRWSKRRKKVLVIFLAQAAANFVGTVMFVAANALAVVHTCDWSETGIVWWIVVMRWTAWNVQFLLSTLSASCIQIKPKAGRTLSPCHLPPRIPASRHGPQRSAPQDSADSALARMAGSSKDSHSPAGHVAVNIRDTANGNDLSGGERVSNRLTLPTISNSTQDGIQGHRGANIHGQRQQHVLGHRQDRIKGPEQQQSGVMPLGKAPDGSKLLVSSHILARNNKPSAGLQQQDETAVDPSTMHRRQEDHTPDSPFMQAPVDRDTGVTDQSKGARKTGPRMRRTIPNVAASSDSTEQRDGEALFQPGEQQGHQLSMFPKPPVSPFQLAPADSPNHFGATVTTAATAAAASHQGAVVQRPNGLECDHNANPSSCTQGAKRDLQAAISPESHRQDAVVLRPNGLEWDHYVHPSSSTQGAEKDSEAAISPASRWQVGDKVTRSSKCLNSSAEQGGSSPSSKTDTAKDQNGSTQLCCEITTSDWHPQAEDKHTSSPCYPQHHPRSLFPATEPTLSHASGTQPTRMKLQGIVDEDHENEDLVNEDLVNEDLVNKDLVNEDVPLSELEGTQNASKATLPPTAEIAISISPEHAAKDPCRQVSEDEPCKDPMVLDDPLGVHLWLLLPWLGFEALVVLNAVWLGGVKGPELALCVDELRTPVRVLVAQTGMLASMGVWFGVFLVQMWRVKRMLKRRPYTDFRLANTMYRLHMRLGTYLFVVLLVGLGLVWLGRLDADRNYSMIVFGFSPVEILWCAVSGVACFLFVPQHPNSLQPLLVQQLQEFAWTEASLKDRIQERDVSTGGMTEGEPMYCLETAANLFYWSCLAYDFSETNPNLATPYKEPDLAELAKGLKLYNLRCYKLLTIPEQSLKALCAWSQDIILITFRGSAHMSNYLADLMLWRKIHPSLHGRDQAAQARVHSGFLTCWVDNGLQRKVMDLVETLINSSLHEVKIYLTGHSLGGALATLAAYDLVKTFNLKPTQVTCYTYGAPRAGNRAFAREYQRCVPDTWHVINDQDVVPRGGKFISMYKRNGHRVIISHIGDMVVRPTPLEASLLQMPFGSSFNNHLLASYQESLAAALLSQLDSQKALEGGLEGSVQLLRSCPIMAETIRKHVLLRVLRAGGTVAAKISRLCLRLCHKRIPDAVSSQIDRSTRFGGVPRDFLSHSLHGNATLGPKSRQRRAPRWKRALTAPEELSLQQMGLTPQPAATTYGTTRHNEPAMAEFDGAEENLHSQERVGACQTKADSRKNSSMSPVVFRTDKHENGKKSMGIAKRQLNMGADVLSTARADKMQQMREKGESSTQAVGSSGNQTRQRAACYHLDKAAYRHGGFQSIEEENEADSPDTMGRNTGGTFQSPAVYEHTPECTPSIANVAGVSASSPVVYEQTHEGAPHIADGGDGTCATAVEDMRRWTDFRNSPMDSQVTDQHSKRNKLGQGSRYRRGHGSIDVSDLMRDRSMNLTPQLPASGMLIAQVPEQ